MGSFSPVQWFEKRPTPPPGQGGSKASIPSGVFGRCPKCGNTELQDTLQSALLTCPQCGHHLRLSARDRLKNLFDEGHYEELDADVSATDPLNFTDSKAYQDRLTAAKKKSGEVDAFVSGSGLLFKRPVLAGAFEFRFMGGSMGSVVGEKVTRLFERATDEKRPVVVFCASGGARMQEGVLSLMQMGKTSAAIGRFRRVKQPFVSVLCDPTTGGVAASFALLGDVILAEPGALIGFAGPRVIEQTIKQKLPDGFQRAEFLFEHGMVDQLVKRSELRPTIGRLVSLLAGPE